MSDPRQEPNLLCAAVIPKFVKELLAAESPTMFGDGEQSRDFVYVRNVVGANVLAMDSIDGIGDAFNNAAVNPMTLADEMKLITKKDIPLI